MTICSSSSSSSVNKFPVGLSGGFVLALEDTSSSSVSSSESSEIVETSMTPNFLLLLDWSDKLFSSFVGEVLSAKT